MLSVIRTDIETKKRALVRPSPYCNGNTVSVSDAPSDIAQHIRFEHSHAQNKHSISTHTIAPHAPVYVLRLTPNTRTHKHILIACTHACRPQRARPNRTCDACPFFCSVRVYPFLFVFAARTVRHISQHNIMNLSLLNQLCVHHHHTTQHVPAPCPPPI